MHSTRIVRRVVGATLACSLLAIGTAAQDAPRWHAFRTDSYEVYAPTAADVDRARPELEFASNQFRRHFGITPPTIAVVLTDDLRGATPAVGDLAERGIPVLHWLTDAAWASRHGGVAAHSESHILPHEACHLFLVTYVNQRISPERAGATVASHYGHPQIPDWFDEGTASLCERGDMQERRRARLKQDLSKRFPLDELFTMAHPMSAGIPVRQAPGRAGPAMASGTKVGAVTFSGSQLPRDLVARAVTFYAQVFSVIEYIARIAEPGSLKVIADRLAAGGSTLEALRGLAGLPDPHDLESAWLATVEK